MKIFIAGCGGMLGEAFYAQFKEDFELKCTDIDTNENWLGYLDFRDYESYRAQVKEFKPDFLFHLGAFTDLEYCETHVEETYKTNTLSVENACYIANELDIPLLYISTAGIFDGRKDLYDDWDLPNPLGALCEIQICRRVVRKGERSQTPHMQGWLDDGWWP